MDRTSHPAATLLRQARRAAKLSQRELAARAGVAQPRIAEIESGRHDTTSEQLAWILVPTGRRLATLPIRTGTAADASEDVARALTSGNDRRAYRRLLQLSDDLARVGGAVRVALTVAPPAPTGDRRYDAFLAALVEHHLAASGLPVPGWTNEPARFARPVWFVADLPRFRAEAWATCPTSFARHGVVLAASELASV